MDIISRICNTFVEIHDGIRANGINIYNIDDYDLLYDIVTYNNDIAKFMKKCIDMCSYNVICSYYKDNTFCVEFKHMGFSYKINNIKDKVFNYIKLLNNVANIAEFLHLHNISFKVENNLFIISGLIYNPECFDDFKAKYDENCIIQKILDSANIKYVTNNSFRINNIAFSYHMSNNSITLFTIPSTHFNNLDEFKAYFN